jgi:hypothetical protein
MTQGTSQQSEDAGRAWVVAADMGYGHQRAVHPLRSIAQDGIITVGRNDAASRGEKRLWSRMLMAYEGLSRARSIPVIGKPLFGLLDSLLRIPSLYPMRNLSHRTFQVNLVTSLVDKGLCQGMLERIAARDLPVVTSFFAPAIAVDAKTQHRIFCIICDADLNRVWIAADPWNSRIVYFAPCGKAARRLRAYGVPENRILLTGFPLPDELVGGREMTTLRANLGRRLRTLDPASRFWPMHDRNLEHYLGHENCAPDPRHVLTITFAVGGAGAQKEIGARIAQSLRHRIAAGGLRLNLLAGTRAEVRDYFYGVKDQHAPGATGLQIIYAESLEEYFTRFSQVLQETDILWTKPSELSFYSALGLPIIMTPALGSQERFNRRWLQEIGAGIRQEDPMYADEWIFEKLRDGIFAGMAWSGFLRARKQGLYRIQEVLRTGALSPESSPIMR